MLSCGSPLMWMIKHCRKNLLASCFRNFGQKKKYKRKLRLEMYRRNSVYSKDNKFNMKLKAVTILAKTCYIEICLQKSEEVCKNRKSNKKFHCNKKKP